MLSDNAGIHQLAWVSHLYMHPAAVGSAFRHLCFAAVWQATAAVEGAAGVAARAAMAVAAATCAAGATGLARLALQCPAPRPPPPPPPQWQRRLPPPLRLESQPPAAELGQRKGTLWDQLGFMGTLWLHGIT